MATITIMKCDICGAETDNSKERWHSTTRTITVKVPIDGVNGGDWSGDWCVNCRIKLDSFLQDMKNNHEQISRKEEPHEGG